MFRASPWISYEPPSDFRNAGPLSDADAPPEDMDDVDMDAPLISTLRDEDTPPPQVGSARTTKFRVKLLVNDNKSSGSSPTPKKQPVVAQSEDDEDDDEEEEDQLIDDEDEAGTLAAAPRSVDVPSKRKPAVKRRPRKSDKQDERKTKPHPPEPPAQLDNLGAQTLEASTSVDKLPPADATSSKAAAKKGTSRKVAGLPRPRKTASKVAKPLAVVVMTDDAAMSEAGTAASSPAPMPQDGGSPEPENIPPPPGPGHPSDELGLESVPLPVYPLPSKPFPVQPPPKIGSGFAPVIPLDKSGKHVRHWRTANREIRGIAGGRWFARAWVGDKDSDYASAQAAAAAAAQSAAQAAAAADIDKHTGISTGNGLPLPKLTPLSISASGSKGPGRGKGAKGQSVSVGPSSRANSAVPDPHAVRTPTKMRTIVAAPPPSPPPGQQKMNIDESAFEAPPPASEP